jgi:hypothetical protein
LFPQSQQRRRKPRRINPGRNPDQNPDRNSVNDGPVPTGFQPPSTRTETKSLFLVWVARNLTTALVLVTIVPVSLVVVSTISFPELSDPLSLLNALNRIKRNDSFQFEFSAPVT